MIHPYKSQPDIAMWSRSVSKNWQVESLTPPDIKLLRKDDKIASLGSCFAANLVPYLKGFNYIKTEGRINGFLYAAPENFAYDKFSAAYGNIYTARQFRQLVDRGLNKFRPKEDRWYVGEDVVDPYRPGLRFKAKSDAEFDALTNYHLSRVKLVFQTASVVIFTMGLTEAWISKEDGAVFPACPGTISGIYDPLKHALWNFTVSEIVADLNAVLHSLHGINPELRLILTVSPVPLVATATADHVLVASTYSKSALRAAVSEVVRSNANVIYFPSYEIITGPQASNDYFEADRRNVSKKGIEEVMKAFLSRCEECDGFLDDAASSGLAGLEHSEKLSRLVTEVECEEAAAGI